MNLEYDNFCSINIISSPSSQFRVIELRNLVLIEEISK